MTLQHVSLVRGRNCDERREEGWTRFFCGYSSDYRKPYYFFPQRKCSVQKPRFVKLIARERAGTATKQSDSSAPRESPAEERKVNSSAFCPRVMPSTAGRTIVHRDRCSAELHRPKISIALLLPGNYKRGSFGAYRDEKFRRSIKPVAPNNLSLFARKRGQNGGPGSFWATLVHDCEDSIVTRLITLYPRAKTAREVRKYRC